MGSPRWFPEESFRADIEAVVLTPKGEKKGRAGRKPYDAILMFQMLVVQLLYNLSDEQIEYQVRDRLSFTRFLGPTVGLRMTFPDARPRGCFGRSWRWPWLIKTLFERFDQHLNAKGLARGGQMANATIVPVPKQQNNRDENETVNRGETPPAWEEKPSKNQQKILCG